MNSITNPLKGDQQTDSNEIAVTLLQVVLQELSDLGWRHDVQEETERTLVTTRVSLEHATVQIVFDINKARERFGLFVYAPLHIPEASRHEVMIYLTRANYRIYLSKFEFDLRDGELRVVSTVIPAESRLSVQMVRRMRADALRVMDDYLPGMLAIVYGHRSADEAWEMLTKASTANEPAPETTTDIGTASSPEEVVA